MAEPKHIPIPLLRQTVRLDSEAGRLYWLSRPSEMFDEGKQSREQNAAIWNARYAGKEAFATWNAQGYRRGTVLNKQHLAHHVVFALHYGRWPTAGVDHRDGDRSNNRPDNLREASQRQNCRNQRAKGGTSPYKGVSWAKRKLRWVTMARDAEGRQRFIGYFLDEIEAARAYDAFARREHGEFARLNFP